MNNVIDFINTNRDKYVEELKAYLAIPSISALPQHAGDVKRCAEWTADEMRRIGLQNVRLIDTPGFPVVYGDWLGAEGAPTILFYGHYDVQPVDPLELWESPPFEATVRDGEIYARGSADDKGQVFMHFKAIEAHLKQNGKLPVNIRIILDELDHPFCEASPDFFNWEHEYMLYHGLEALMPYTHTTVHAKYWNRWDPVDVGRCVRILDKAGYKGVIALEYEDGPWNGIEGAKQLMKLVMEA